MKAMRGFLCKLTAYYPPGPQGYETEAEARMEGGPLDRMGKPLHTLQAYLAGHAPYVSVAMDSKAFRYGTVLCIPDLEEKHGVPIEFRVVDTGGAFRGAGRGKADICVQDKKASFDKSVNQTTYVVALVNQ